MGAPPAAEMRDSPVQMPGEDKMTPSGFPAPPLPLRASHRICGVPPNAVVFFNFPSAKKPRDCPSGDQNGKLAPSVPGRGLADREARGRIQSCVLPSSEADSATRLPSGEIAKERMTFFS